MPSRRKFHNRINKQLNFLAINLFHNVHPITLAICQRKALRNITIYVIIYRNLTIAPRKKFKVQTESFTSIFPAKT